MGALRRLNSDHVSLKVAYNLDFVNSIKELPFHMRSWNAENKSWDVPAEEYHTVKFHLAAAGWLLPDQPSAAADDDDGDDGGESAFTFFYV